MSTSKTVATIVKSLGHKTGKQAKPDGRGGFLEKGFYVQRIGKGYTSLSARPYATDLEALRAAGIVA